MTTEHMSAFGMSAEVMSQVPFVHCCSSLHTTLSAEDLSGACIKEYPGSCSTVSKSCETCFITPIHFALLRAGGSADHSFIQLGGLMRIHLFHIFLLYSSKP